jgi:hypothetical protein
MRPDDIQDLGPAVEKTKEASAYERLMKALDKLEGKLNGADNERIRDLPYLLDDIACLCSRAKDAALLLEEKCK